MSRPVTVPPLYLFLNNEMVFSSTGRCSYNVMSMFYLYLYRLTQNYKFVFRFLFTIYSFSLTLFSQDLLCVLFVINWPLTTSRNTMPIALSQLYCFRLCQLMKIWTYDLQLNFNFSPMFVPIEEEFVCYYAWQFVKDK